MKSLIILLISFLVYAYAFPAYEEPTDSDDPRNYKNIEILLLESAVDQDGGYSFSFENDDGSKVSQEGQHKIIDDEHAVEEIHGSYSYNDVNGQPVSLTYTADENGFRPIGAHLPTTPPVPLEILRSLKFLATAKPFVDDQLYDYKPKKKVFRGRQYSTLNAVQRARSSLRSNSFRKSLIDETPSRASLKSAEDQRDTKPETTSERVPEVSSEMTLETTQKTTEKSVEKPSVETTLAVVNESKKKINEALKESIEKTSKLTQSATKETAGAAIAAIRGEVDKLNDNVKSQITKINEKISGTKAEVDKQVSKSEKQSRDIIEKYTDIVSDAVSTADEALIKIAPTEVSV